MLAVGALAIAVLSTSASAGGPLTGPATDPSLASGTLGSWAAGTSIESPEGANVEADLAALDDNDHRATLEAIQYALMEVADGASFVWRRTTSRLHGVVRPTSSFRDSEGRVCRHIELGLSAGTVTRRIEGIACREATGVWLLAS